MAFAKYYQGMALNGLFVALYERDSDCFLAVVEKGSKSLGARRVTQEQLDAISGNSAGKLAQMIEWITHGRISFEVQT